MPSNRLRGTTLTTATLTPWKGLMAIDSAKNFQPAAIFWKPAPGNQEGTYFTVYQKRMLDILIRDQKHIDIHHGI